VSCSLKKADIIPTILPDFTPTYTLIISYPNDISVYLGNKLSPKDTKNAPIVLIKPILSDSDPNIELHLGHEDEENRLKELVASTTGSESQFTVILTDPDAPSRKTPKWSEMCHWIATVTSASDLVKYKAPDPPEKTGYHRYIFVLLMGDNKNLTAPEERQHWGFPKPKKGERRGVADWAEKEGLEIVGANWFYEKYED
jgi:phosphatidylethanolamine-binding protein (PEBP) family uncharacterized protein